LIILNSSHENKNGELHFYFTELNRVPEEFKIDKFSTKEFFLEAAV
jgi:hypothetical protein